MSAAPVIVCEGVGKRFDATWVLRGVDLEVRPGELLGVIGPGGHGKSVLLRLLAGLLVPDEGRVLIDGRDLATLSALQLAEAGAIGDLRDDGCEEGGPGAALSGGRCGRCERGAATAYRLRGLSAA